MAMSIVACAVAAFGFVVLLAGLVLVLKRVRLAGAIVSLLGIGLITVPVLTFLYVAWTMR